MKIEQVDLQALAADAEQPVGERIAAGEEVEDEDGQWVSLQSILKIIPRDDRHDPFKPNSLGSIHRLACKGRRAKDRLTVEEEKLLQAYGAYLDLCLPLDRNDPPGLVYLALKSVEKTMIRSYQIILILVIYLLQVLLCLTYPERAEQS